MDSTGTDEFAAEGERVTVGETTGRVIEVRVLAQELVAELEDGTRVVVAASDINPPPPPPQQQQQRPRRRRKKR